MIEKLTLFPNIQHLLSRIRDGEPLTMRQQLVLTIQLSLPAIFAQLSTILMQYVDASMLGRLGANASAAVGLVASATWLVGGMSMSLTVGFTVQVAHRIGAKRFSDARNIMRQAFIVAFLFIMSISIPSMIISHHLPYWLGGGDEICGDAGDYFFIYALALPAMQMYSIAGGMLRCSGNMHVPSVASIVMCVLDVILNIFLIFPTREVDIAGCQFVIYGADLGVRGAALATALAELVTALFLMFYLLTRSRELAIFGKRNNHDVLMRGRSRSFLPTRATLKEAFRIGFPMGIEHIVMCSAQVISTIIVAPLGVMSIAANSFAVTAESLCYMPGYGIGDAATTLIGQSIGAKRRDLTRRFAFMSVGLGMFIMSLMGVVMYFCAPLMMSILSPVEEIRDLGVMALRIEAWAEPMFAASIVAYGVFVGAGDTLVPCGMNFLSMWGVRLTLAASLAPVMGLRGAWLAMCIELCFRGLIFLVRLFGRRWMRRIEV
ncbi:MAG: MATE family efflux transporter [Marinilabiliaceae bacterium]|nr:MATE family efflux transporter [Marinilabiliaceae bacterium]